MFDPVFVRRIFFVAAVCLVLAPVGQAATGSITEFPLPTADLPWGMTAGPDGNLWIARNLVITRMTLAGAVTDYPIPYYRASAYDITVGPDGNLWASEYYGERLDRITTAGVFTKFPFFCQCGQWPVEVTAGPDGKLWYANSYNNTIGTMTTAGVEVAEYLLGVGGHFGPRFIAAGADGNLWSTDHDGSIVRMATSGSYTTFPNGGGQMGAGPDGNIWLAHGASVGRITPSGSATFLPLPAGESADGDLTAGSDGNLWFIDGSRNAIGRITPSGVVTEFAIPTAASAPDWMTLGSDGNIWFGERGAVPKIGRVQVAKPKTRYVLSTDGAFIPQSRTSVQGYAVQWTFQGPRVHEVQDASGLGLFDSGPKRIVSFFSYTFTAAGTYAYRDPMNAALAGKISVPLLATPTSGTASVAFTLTWATAAPTGARVFDVQVKRPGATAYTSWRTATTNTSGTFTPDAGAGTYSFRARVRDSVTGAASGYSAGKSVSVS